MKKIHLLIIIPIVMSIIMSISLVVFDLYFYTYDAEKEVVLPTPEAIAQEVNITLNNYIVFDFDDLDFNFMVVDVTLTSNEVMDMIFDDIYTSEDIFISNYSTYIETLTNSGLDINIQNVDFDLPKDMESYTVRLFVPIINKDIKSIDLIFGRYENVQITLDQTVKAGTKEMLGFNAQDEAKLARLDAGTIKVLDVSDFSGKTIYETMDGKTEATEFPATAKIHAILLEIDVDEDASIKISTAKYIFTKTEKESTALPARISIEELHNIYSEEITSDTTAYLFFDLYSSASTLMEEPAYLELYIEGVDEPYVFTLIE